MRNMHIFERIGNKMFIIGSTPNRVIGEHFEELARAHGKTTLFVLIFTQPMRLLFVIAAYPG